MSDNSQDASKHIQTKITELQNVNRLIANTLNLIADVEIKGAYAQPVSEILQWLTGFKDSVNTQITTLQAALPKPEVIVPAGAGVAPAPAELSEVKV